MDLKKLLHTPMSDEDRARCEYEREVEISNWCDERMLEYLRRLRRNLNFPCSY